MSESYESFLGLVERPFSLTPDPKYFFRSRSHGRALETVTFALRARQRFALVTGDLGVGKSVLCRALVDQLQRRNRLVSYVSSPLLREASLLRLLLEDFGAVSTDEVRRGVLINATAGELLAMLVDFLGRLQRRRTDAAIIVDEAHLMPRSSADLLQSLSALKLNGEQAVQVVLVGQAMAGESCCLGIDVLDDAIAAKLRLLPLESDECGDYLSHRMAIAGSGTHVTFSRRAVDFIFSLSGGVPRLVNLLCERALQEAASAGVQQVEPATIDRAAAALQLLRTRPRRFRWFKRVS